MGSLHLKKHTCYNFKKIDFICTICQCFYMFKICKLYKNLFTKQKNNHSTLTTLPHEQVFCLMGESNIIGVILTKHTSIFQITIIAIIKQATFKSSDITV